MTSRQTRLRVSAALFVAVGLVSCDKKSPTEPEPDCTATISPTAVSMTSGGGTAAIPVTIAAGCSWQAQSSAAWLTVSPATGSGPGTVTLTAASNESETPRSGMATIAARTVTVSQAGRDPLPPTCTFSTTPEAASFTKDGGTGAISVTAPTGCQWTAATTASWITITSGAAGNGNGTVTFAVARTREPAARTATLLVAGRSIAITQAGDAGACEYQVTPVSLSACMGAAVLTTTITTAASCAWTALPSDSWMQLNVQSGTGPATIQIAVGDNYDAPRSGIVMVRWPTPTQGQNVSLAQAGCRYGVTQTLFAVGAGGGTNTFDVLQQSDPISCGGALQDRCIWSAVADVPWIVINTSMPRSGDGPVSFTVLPNAGPPRAGTIRVRDRVVHVQQSGI